MKCLEGDDHKHNYGVLQHSVVNLYFAVYLAGSQNKHTSRDTVTPVCNILVLAQKRLHSFQILSQNINVQYALSTLTF